MYLSTFGYKWFFLYLECKNRDIVYNIDFYSCLVFTNVVVIHLKTEFVFIVKCSVIFSIVTSLLLSKIGFYFTGWKTFSFTCKFYYFTSICNKILYFTDIIPRKIKYAEYLAIKQKEEDASWYKMADNWFW